MNFNALHPKYLLFILLYITSIFAYSNPTMFALDSIIDAVQHRRGRNMFPIFLNHQDLQQKSYALKTQGLADLHNDNGYMSANFPISHNFYTILDRKVPSLAGLFPPDINSLYIKSNGVPLFTLSDDLEIFAYFEVRSSNYKAPKISQHIYTYTDNIPSGSDVPLAGHPHFSIDLNIVILNKKNNLVQSTDFTEAASDIKRDIIDSFNYYFKPLYKLRGVEQDLPFGTISPQMANITASPILDIHVNKITFSLSVFGKASFSGLESALAWFLHDVARIL